MIFDRLTEVFGEKQSVPFQMLSDDELAVLYERIENDEELEFEFEEQVYNDFDDMLDLAEA